MRIYKLNEIKQAGVPNGWIVRVLRDETGRLKTADFGVFIDTEVFVSIPIHYNTLPNLICINGDYVVEGEFYAIPESAQLRLIKTKVKQTGKTIPMLVPCKEGQQASMLSCMTYVAKQGESIINVTSDNIVVRDYLPKTRNVIALIMVGQDNVIAPNFAVNIITGRVGLHETTNHTIKVNYEGTNSVTQLPETKDEVVKTEFVTFKRFLPTNRMMAKTDKPETKVAEAPKPQVNNKPQTPVQEIKPVGNKNGKRR